MAVKAYQSLASRYRPQSFAEVVGQPAAATALSRASALGQPAPAYLLSGTRGVGKTTIARIFAKALNCTNGPAAEPCNECPQCRHVTEGNHVDVCEIDAASNTGVDDVRALRENLGFLPMEGKFKVFIVDEAHMLSKSAFNALLKTLEEPPRHTVFIFATTEVHRFPATIISRCQHYIFRHLPEQAIFGHLTSILEREGRKYDQAGVRLIAARAAGSARDGLSLLDQALCLGNGEITAAGVRQSLGIAGQQFFERYFQAMAGGDLGQIIDLAGELLSSGIDIGYFLKELAANLRSLFLCRQSEGKLLPALGDFEDRAAFLRDTAALFPAAHLHAAWQMVLQSQRSILQSPQPGDGLELLLLNMAILPSLVPMAKAAPLKYSMDAPATPRQASPEREQTRASMEPESSPQPFTPDWAGFCDFCRKAPAEESPPPDVLRLLKAEWMGDKLVLLVESTQLWEKLQKNKRILNTALQAYCQGRAPEVEYRAPAQKKTRQEMLDDCAQNPQVQLCQEIMGARLADCYEKGVKNAEHE